MSDCWLFNSTCAKTKRFHAIRTLVKHQLNPKFKRTAKYVYTCFNKCCCCLLALAILFNSIYMKRATQRLPLRTELQLKQQQQQHKHQAPVWNNNNKTDRVLCKCFYFHWLDVLVCVCVLIAAQETIVLFILLQCNGAICASNNNWLEALQESNPPHGDSSSWTYLCLMIEVIAIWNRILSIIIFLR